jgi:NAD(P)-dependent dehydrogenase (short-subunit alcohol dehydrogenase family)
VNSVSTAETPFSLAGELALITGGGSGLGLAMAQCFVTSGARVVLLSRSEAKLQAAVQQLGPHASYEVSDLTDWKATKNAVERISAREGPISILINNAGNHLKKAALETSDAEFATILNTHVNATFSLTRLVAAGMLERRHGSILFIASMAALMGVPLVAAYSAAKSAHLGLIRGLAAEWSSAGVRVNGIAPGWIDTAMVRAALAGDEDRATRILNRTPMRRFGDAHDVGWAAVYLCSPAAAFVTAVVLPVDGGASIGF